MATTSITWRTSSRSGSNGGDCVEVAATSASITVRDSKDPSGPVLAFGRGTFRLFVTHLKNT